jgi:hypothetical protein
MAIDDLSQALRRAADDGTAIPEAVRLLTRHGFIGVRIRGRLKNGTKVRTCSVLTARSLAAVEHRRGGDDGFVIGHSDSHGLCYHVIHPDNTTAWYNPEELVVPMGG